MRHLVRRVRARIRRLMGLGWALFEVEVGVVHVAPRRDLIEHDLTQDCVCVPDSEMVTTTWGDGWVFTHHSLDGRERREHAQDCTGC